MPTVSVILITYNRSEMLKKAIQSVLEQTYHDFELIIIDDCSTDNTLDVVREFKDKRIRYERLDKNSGGSLNPHQRGFELATGEYIAHLDDDDYWCDKQKIELQVAYFKKYPESVLVGTQAMISDKNGEITGYTSYPLNDDKIRNNMLMQNWFINSSVMYRKESVKVAGGYAPFTGGHYFGMVDEYTLWVKIGMTGIMANLPINGVLFNNATKVKFRYKVEYMFRQFQRIKKYGYYYGNTLKAYLFNIAITVIEMPSLSPLKYVLKKLKGSKLSLFNLLKFLVAGGGIAYLTYLWIFYIPRFRFTPNFVSVSLYIIWMAVVLFFDYQMSPFIKRRSHG